MRKERKAKKKTWFIALKSLTNPDSMSRKFSCFTFKTRLFERTRMKSWCHAKNQVKFMIFLPFFNRVVSRNKFLEKRDELIFTRFFSSKLNPSWIPHDVLLDEA